jgi:hypothetical protein
MPIRQTTNNRVLPNNARAADVARDTLQAVASIQSRRSDAAFQVNGYAGILYSYLEFGTPCACKAKSRAIFSRLDKEGKASIGDINQMLNPNNSFGIRPYAEAREQTPSAKKQEKGAPHFLKNDLTLKVSLNKSTPASKLASLFDTDDLAEEVDENDTAVANRERVGLNRHGSQQSGSMDMANEIVEGDPSDYVENSVTNFDTGLFGLSDVSCPICFGSGFVGGYAILGGTRKILTFQDKTISLPSHAVIQHEKEIPLIKSDKASWSVILPFGCVSVDALRVWCLDNQITPWYIWIDGESILKDIQVIKYCDGRPHLLEIGFEEMTEFSHVELQLNQSDLEANFELPRLNSSSNLSLRERTDPFTINLSARIPYVKTLDVIVESTLGKVLQVKGTTGLHDRRATTTAWDVEVRPTQPQELFDLLPRRKPRQALNKPNIVRDNSSPNGMYSRT